MTRSAAILAGGLSTRMGRDKAWIDLGGRPIITRVASALAAVAGDLFVVANDERYATLGHRVIPDLVRGQGPLAGMAAALAASRYEIVLISACDMPLQRAEVWRALVDLLGDFDAVIPTIDRRRHPLHGVYRTRCLARAEEALARGERRVGAFVERLRIREVGDAELRAIDPDLNAFLNLNSPADLRRAAELVLEG